MTVLKGGHIIELQPVLTSKLPPICHYHRLGEFVKTFMCQMDGQSKLVFAFVRGEVHTFVVDIAQPASGYYSKPDATYILGVDPTGTITCHRL